MSTINESFRKVRFFLADVRDELRKSTWPTRGELMESTAVVMLSVVLFAVFVWVCDALLRLVIGLLAHH